MKTQININPANISLDAEDIKIKDTGNIISATNVEGALQENRSKINAHVAGTADKHSAAQITYTGNVTGTTEVKGALDKLQTSINNLSMTGSQHDALVTAALIDVENENFNTAEKGYLNGRLEKWEQRTKAIENDIFEAYELGAVLTQQVMQHKRLLADLEGEVGQVTLTNTQAYPFNNSKVTVALQKARDTLNYTVETEIISATGFPGEIKISDKQLNGFKIEFTGSATSVTVKYIVRGGMYQ